MATRTTVLVTACDRQGHLIDRVRITRQTEDECIRDRRVAFAYLRAKHPDCQVYYDWNRASAEPLTKPLRGDPEFDAQPERVRDAACPPAHGASTMASSPDPMARYHRQFGSFLDELFDSVVERRPMRRFCDDCAERMATETWRYDEAPIPSPPAAEHLCSACADSRRDRDTERKMER